MPGPTSVVAALVVSGLPTDRFCVEGFLPRKGGSGGTGWRALMADERTTVVLEAPGRVAATLAELAAVDAARPVAVVRELTKVHEEVWRGTAGRGGGGLRAQRQVRGEVVVVIGGAPPAGPVSDEAIDDAVRRAPARGPGEGPRQIALVVAEELGVPRRRSTRRCSGSGARRRAAPAVRSGRAAPPVRYRRCRPTT